MIHTVGPVYRGGKRGERELLASCYRQSLLLAEEYHCESVAFPLISAGVFGYPKDQAIRVAADAITEFLVDHDMTVYLVLFNRTAYTISKKLYADIKSYIDDVYVAAHTDPERLQNARWNTARRAEEEAWELELSIQPPSSPMDADADGIFGDSMAMPFDAAAPSKPSPGLEALLRQKDESFSQMLLRKIDERGMKDSECYKRANIDRKLFSKIRSDIRYKPSKPTVLAFAVALELPLEETKDMLMKAGYALSRSNEFDIIVEYFIRRKNYNVFEINEALFAFDQNLLGGIK